MVREQWTSTDEVKGLSIVDSYNTIQIYYYLEIFLQITVGA